MSAVVDFPIKPEARPYLETFGHARHKSDPDWLAGYRNRSLARFAELGFPSRRSEAWRYLDLHRLEQRPMLPVAGGTAAVTSAVREQLAEIGLAEPAHRLVLLNGRFAPELSRLDQLPSQVWLGPMAAAIAERPDLVRAGLEAQLAQNPELAKRVRRERSHRFDQPAPQLPPDLELRALRRTRRMMALLRWLFGLRRRGPVRGGRGRRRW